MKILIAIDSQESGIKLAQQVIDHIGDGGSEILVLHVIEPFANLSYMAGLPHPLFQEMERDATLAARVMVRNVALKFRDDYHSTRIYERVAFGNPAEVILQEGNEYGADCIVVGCRCLKGLQKYVVSSVSRAVLEKAPCPVLVVRDRHVRQGLTDKIMEEQCQPTVTAHI